MIVGSGFPAVQYCPQLPPGFGVAAARVAIARRPSVIDREIPRQLAGHKSSAAASVEGTPDVGATAAPHEPDAGATAARRARRRRGLIAGARIWWRSDSAGARIL